MPRVRHSDTPQIAKALQTRIEAGQYAPGTWLPTERTLAAEFAVNRTIIRSALATLEDRGLIVRAPGHRPWVSDQIRLEPPSDPTERRGTVPRTIAAILPQHSRFPSAMAILRGAGQVLQAQKTPFHLAIFDNLVGSGPVDPRWEKRALESAEQGNVAGLLIWPMGEEHTAGILQRLRARGLPIIFLDRFAPDMDGDFVGIDNQYSAREAVHYLLELGHTRIAHVTTLEPILTVHARTEGYREALLLHGIEPDPALFYALPFGEPWPSGVIETLFSPPVSATAVFTLNDRIAQIIIAKLEGIGLRVPDDVSIIGFDDVEQFGLSPAKMTTVRQPFELMGQRAAELLLHRIRHPQTGHPSWRHLMLPAPLIVRSTCRRLE
jgi:DNA-binding LacI/PurR family transcriptional regulator